MKVGDGVDVILLTFFFWVQIFSEGNNDPLSSFTSTCFDAHP